MSESVSMQEPGPGQAAPDERKDLAARPRLYRPGDDWHGDPQALAPGSLWVYALSGRCRCAQPGQGQLSLPAQQLLLSPRPPADWSLAGLTEGDLVLRLPAMGRMAGAGPGQVLSAGPSRLLRLLLEALAEGQQELGQGAAEADTLPAWHARLEESILSLLAAQATHAASDAEAIAEADAALPTEAAPIPARDQHRLDRMMVYMHSRLCAPLSSEDLARAAGLSIRALHTLCQRHHRSTPMELLRAKRLDAVRQRLRSEPEAAVGDVALQLGFGHLGRFSAYYRDRFGELPHETRARHQGHRGSRAGPPEHPPSRPNRSEKGLSP